MAYLTRLQHVGVMGSWTVSCMLDPTWPPSHLYNVLVDKFTFCIGIGRERIALKRVFGLADT